MCHLRKSLGPVVKFKLIYSDVSFIRAPFSRKIRHPDRILRERFFLLYFDSITSEIPVPEPDVKIWEPMYRNNRIPAR